MPITDRFDAMGKAIKAAAAIIAALPSIATLTGLIETPDEQAVVVTFICGFVGVVCILSVAILSPVIGRARPLRIASVVVALTVAGAISSVSYYIFAKGHVVVVEEGGKPLSLIIPLSPSPSLRRLIAPYGDGDDYAEAIETSTQRFQIIAQMRKDDASAVAGLVLLLILSQALLVSGVAAAAWRVAGDDSASRS